LGWFVLPRVRALARPFVAVYFPSVFNAPPESATPYQIAGRVWARRLGFARSQASNWRLAALGSTTLAAMLGLAFAVSTSRASVTPYIIATETDLAEPRIADVTIASHKLSDAEIAFLLTRLVKKLRSLSIDPVVVRANWLDAYAYLTGPAAQTLSDHARHASSLTRVGTRAVIVEVTYVVRASDDAFEIRWTEKTYEKGLILKTERFTGVAATTFKAVTVEALKRNPLGLIVSAISWSHDSIDSSK
jgi:type IV secretion system protein VirB5